MEVPSRPALPLILHVDRLRARADEMRRTPDIQATLRPSWKEAVQRASQGWPYAALRRTTGPWCDTHCDVKPYFEQLPWDPSSLCIAEE